MAACDADGVLAFPVSTVPAGVGRGRRAGRPWWRSIGRSRCSSVCRGRWTGVRARRRRQARARADRLSRAVGCRAVDRRAAQHRDRSPAAAGRRTHRQGAAGRDRRSGGGGHPGTRLGTRTGPGTPAGGVSIGTWRRLKHGRPEPQETSQRVIDARPGGQAEPGERDRARGKGCLAVIVAAAVLAFGGYVVWDKATTFVATFGEVPDYPGPGNAKVTVDVPAGASLDVIGGILVEKDVVKSNKAWTRPSARRSAPRPCRRAAT